MKGFGFRRALSAIGKLAASLLPQKSPAKKVVREYDFNPRWRRYQPPRFGKHSRSGKPNGRRNGRSQYDVVNHTPTHPPPEARPCLPMWSHDVLVRRAMAAGVKRAAQAVSRGWRPPKINLDLQTNLGDR